MDFPIFAESDPVPLDYAEKTHEIVLSILTTGQNARMCPIIIKLEKGLYE